MTKTIADIDPSKVKGGLGKYAGQYVVLSTKNEVLGSGVTYEDAIRGVSENSNIAIFPIPVTDVDIAPIGQRAIQIPESPAEFRPQCAISGHAPCAHKVI